MARRKLEEEQQPPPKNLYFINQEELQFIKSGCTILDCALGGGWPLGRVSNIVGDRSTGKTLLAIEACANFARQFPNGKIYYREAEAAFDTAYAAALGMPVERVDFDGSNEFHTVEDFYEDLGIVLKNVTAKQAALYIVDSLDALSDREELERAIDDKTYGANKAKTLSEIFRRLVKLVEKSNVHLMIISQVRTNMNAKAFGEKTTRSGGKALDFYASQIIHLHHIKTLKRIINKIERPDGVRVLAKVRKNKVGLPFREAEFEIKFGFGTDDLVASLEWLDEVGQLEVLDTSSKELSSFLKNVEALPDEEYFKKVSEIGEAVKAQWLEIEKSFLPKRSKYG